MITAKKILGGRKSDIGAPFKGAAVAWLSKSN